ncbi:MAG: hypothetical protein HXY41_17640 [Chloroflexi bacterium]|nr:hypothetical protein [Chloroflexota bacterium]
MWVIAEYEATALFTLKPASATSSGGKSLLVPTPFSIKMALLDVACRLEGQRAAESAWEWLAALPVAISPARRAVVNNTFTKVLKPRRNPAEPGSQHAGYFGKSIAYREYVYLDGKLGIALQTTSDEQAQRLVRWLVNVNYLGKRGSFVQLDALPYIHDALPFGYLLLDGRQATFPLDSLMTQLDDAGEKLTFSHANIYSSDSIRLGVHRVLRHVALPYRRVGSSRSYTHYERSDLERDI